MSDATNIHPSREAVREETALALAARAAAMRDISNWKNHGGDAPFDGFTSPNPTDRAGSLLFQVTSLLATIGAGYEDAVKLEAQGVGESELLRYRGSLPGSLDAVSTLVDLAAYAIDAQYAVEGGSAGQ